MSKPFFVPSEVYEKRITQCKSCEYYQSLLGNCKICGCFMKIKARISQQHCPKYFWKMHDFGYDPQELTKDLPQDLIDEVRKIYPDIKTGKAKDQATKRKMIELYNIIYGGQYNTTTNCSGCLNTCFKGISKIYHYYEEL
jgi:hypothetical protein